MLLLKRQAAFIPRHSTDGAFEKARTCVNLYDASCPKWQYLLLVAIGERNVASLEDSLRRRKGLRPP